MVMEHTPAAEGLEREPSADAAGIQPESEQGQEPDLGEQLGAIIDERLRARLEVIERRIQSFTDRTANTLTDLAQRLETLRSEVGNTADIRDMTEALYELSVDPTDRETRALKRQLAQAEKAAQQPAPQPKPAQAQAQLPPAEGEAQFLKLVAPNLERHARRSGFSDAEINADNWMNRLYSMGAPQEMAYTPDGMAAYTEAMTQAIDALAQQERNKRRPRTVTPNVSTSGGGRVNDIEQYRAALKKDGALPSAAEIDRMTARYLSG